MPHRLRPLLIVALILPLLQAAAAHADEGGLAFITLSDDGSHFVKADTGERFNPWGFNYDHHQHLEDALLEDYWHEHWDTVVEDFHKMKALRANAVRIHLQFAPFMDSPTDPNEESLDQLARLLQLAEEVGLYINLTGLGSYHPQDVPDWYHEMTESERWDAQANFWRAVAATASDSPAIFCYNLMNEPVVPGGDEPRDDWVGGGFADTGKHFVQFISRDRAGRERPEIARDWIRHLTAAIREHDERHLITVGLVHWSLDRPGLTSGFVPDRIADDLDFLAVHIYPEAGEVDVAIETLEGFDVGKPVIISETYTLRAGLEDLDAFLRRSRDTATGWFGFFWGRNIEDLTPPGTLREAIQRQWLEYFRDHAHTFRRP